MCFANADYIRFRFLYYCFKALVFFVGHAVCVHVYYVESFGVLVMTILVNLFWLCWCFEEFCYFGLFGFWGLSRSRRSVYVVCLGVGYDILCYLMLCWFASHSANDLSDISSSSGHAELLVSVLPSSRVV